MEWWMLPILTFEAHFNVLSTQSKHYTLSPRRQRRKKKEKKKPTYTFISSTSHVFPPARVVRVSESWVARFCKLLAIHWIWIGSIRISDNIDSNTSTVAFTQCSIFLQRTWNINMINHENMPIPGSWHFISFSFFPYHLNLWVAIFREPSLSFVPIEYSNRDTFIVLSKILRV